MARTVAFSQHNKEPLWLTQGKLALQLQRDPESTGDANQEVFSEIGARTARRFARLAEFLERNFPDYFEGRQSILAGSAAVQEFIKLFEVDKSTALEVADQSLEGKLGVRELRTIRDKSLSSRTVPKVTSRIEGSRRAAEFAELADRRLREQNLIPELHVTEGAETRPPNGPVPLIPDLVMLERSTGKIVAVEFKAPTDTAARSVGYVAGQLISRIAALRLRYDDAVLVMPKEAESIARETVQLWRQWVCQPHATAHGISILLLDENTQTWIKANDQTQSDQNESPSQRG